MAYQPQVVLKQGQGRDCEKSSILAESSLKRRLYENSKPRIHCNKVSGKIQDGEQGKM